MLPSNLAPTVDVDVVITVAGNASHPRRYHVRDLEAAISAAERYVVLEQLDHLDEVHLRAYYVNAADFLTRPIRLPEVA
jgi:hypothetical protein